MAKVKISSEDSKPFWILCQRRGTIIHPPSNEKGLRDIGHSMSMVLDTRKSVFGRQRWLQFPISFIMTLYYKIRQILLQNATAMLLQNGIKVCYKMHQVFYYKMWQFYYKMWRVLDVHWYNWKIRYWKILPVCCKLFAV